MTSWTASCVWPFWRGDGQRHCDAVVVEHLAAHLGGRALAHAENVIHPLGFQRGDGGGRDHAAIGDDAGPLDAEAGAQARDHGQQHRDVGGVAGDEERGDRPVPLVEHDAEHHLLQMAAVVLGMAALAEGFAAGALEPQAGGVEERQRDGAEQRQAMAVERLLDGFGGPVAGRVHLAKPRHGLVGLIEVEVVRTGHAKSVAPSAGVTVRAGDHQAVQHGEIDRPLDIEAEAPPGQQAAQHVAASGFGPQAAKHQVGSDADAAQFGQFATVEAGEDDGAAGVFGGRGDQPVEHAGGLDLVAAAKRFDHTLNMASALADVLYEVEMFVGPDLLDADEHGQAPCWRQSTTRIRGIASFIGVQTTRIC